jgi:hypothetical protein
MMARLVSAYDADGMTVDEYYNNIRLPDLTRQEFSWLKDMASGAENV